MVDKPPIEWFGCHALNTIPRPADVKYEAIVWHTTGGGSTIDGLSAWFNGGNIAAGMRGSTYFGVDRTGRIGQFLVPYTSAAPIANGQRENATAKLVKENQGLNANFWTLNIEHLDAGTPGSVTPIQLERSAWLSAYMWQEWIAPYVSTTGATLDRDHFLQHYEFDPTDRPNCASWTEARMLQQIQRIRALLTPTPPPDPTPPPSDDWKHKYYTLAGEVQTWLHDDTQMVMKAAEESVTHMVSSEALRLDRIEQITKG